MKSVITTNLGTTTTYFVSNYYEVTGDGEVTKYYYAGAQRVAMREYTIPQPSTLSYILDDHLGSTSITTDASGNLISELRYKPWGEVRMPANGQNPGPSNYTYTGQYSYTGDFGLMFYNARWYDPYLNHFTQPDTIVPDPYNSQAWDRYAYALNNPIRYNDPSGHCAVCGFAMALAAAYLGGRSAYELGTLVIPGQDQASRNAVGGALVTNLSDVINEESAAQGVDPTLTAAVLRHESSAVERRMFTVIPRTIPGVIANTAEHAQWAMQGDTASIGPGQMQVQRALELEQLGYVTSKGSEQGTISALMGNETSVEYVTGMLHYISDQLNTLDGFSQLPVEEQQRLVLIGYNWGWTGDFLKELKDRGYLGMIDFSKYDNQTLDEYRRWRNRGFEE